MIQSINVLRYFFLEISLLAYVTLSGRVILMCVFVFAALEVTVEKTEVLENETRMCNQLLIPAFIYATAKNR